MYCSIIQAERLVDELHCLVHASGIRIKSCYPDVGSGVVGFGSPGFRPPAYGWSSMINTRGGKHASPCYNISSECDCVLLLYFCGAGEGLCC